MSIGQGRPGEIEPSGSPIFRFSQRHENAFRAAKTGFSDTGPARPNQRNARQEEIMKPTILFSASRA
jgi:hypothetical protein